MNTPTTFGQYIDAYADLPGVTQDMIADFSDAASAAPTATVEAAAVYYEAARQIAETGTYRGDLLAELAALGHGDIPWFIIACAPTRLRAMREIGLHLQHGLELLAGHLHRALAAAARFARKVMRHGA